MPELPDVEAMRRYIERTSIGKEIGYVDVRASRMLEGTGAIELDAALRGRAFTSARRHCKYLFAAIDGIWLYMHFGMTGGLVFFKDTEPLHARVVFGFRDGTCLAFVDTRMFGKAGLTKERAKEANPSAEACNNLGNAYLMAGKKAQTLREYRAALAVDPADVFARENIGRVLSGN